MKKAVSIVIIGLLLLTTFSTAFAASAVSVSKQTAEPGDTVTISGTASADENVAIKIVDGAGNIVHFSAVKADSSGKYSASFTVPADMADGVLKVTAGSGNNIASATIDVQSPPTPTSLTTEQPTTQPTAQPTTEQTTQPTIQATPNATSTVATTQTPMSAISTPLPTDRQSEATPMEESKLADVITPVEVKQDAETGIVTIVIDVDDLPDDTAAIKLPNGDTVVIADAKNGKLVIEVNADDIGANGEIVLTLLNDEMIAQGTVTIKTTNVENNNISWLAVVLWILGGAALLFIAVLIFAKLKKR